MYYIYIYVQKTKLTIVYVINDNYHKLSSFSRKSQNLGPLLGSSPIVEDLCLEVAVAGTWGTSAG